MISFKDLPFVRYKNYTELYTGVVDRQRDIETDGKTDEMGDPYL